MLVRANGNAPTVSPHRARLIPAFRPVGRSNLVGCMGPLFSTYDVGGEVVNVDRVGAGTPRVRVPLLDIDVTPMNARIAAEWAAGQSRKALLLNHNLHSAYLYQRDPQFRALYALADQILVDGAPILWLGRLRDRATFQRDQRIGSTDWIDHLSRTPLRSPKTLAILGARPESNHEAVVALRQRIGACGWTVVGLDGYQDDTDALKWLTDVRPDLVLVGLGMPQQEHFLLRNFQALPTAVYATVGGAIDYIAGVNILAPRWMGRLGLEWLWRLWHEPRRLGHRYLIEPILLTREIIAREYRRLRSR